jgi:hypothetical protein
MTAGRLACEGDSVPRKRQNVKTRYLDLTQQTLFRLSDGLYAAPSHHNPWEKFRNDDDELWPELREGILQDWIRERPCTRPLRWWESDAPKMDVAELERRGWLDSFFAAAMPELRLRLGGIGDPEFEHLAVVPEIEYGLPVYFLDNWSVLYYNHAPGSFTGKAIDPLDPPRYESQAAFLERHGLLTAQEQKYLEKAPELLTPETITTDEAE